MQIVFPWRFLCLGVVNSFEVSSDATICYLVYKILPILRIDTHFLGDTLQS